MVVRHYFATRTKAYEEWTHERQKGGEGVPLTEERGEGERGEERGDGERGEGGRRPPEERGEGERAAGGRLGWWPVVSLGGVTRWPRFRCRGSGSHVAHVARGGGSKSGMSWNSRRHELEL